LAVCCRREGHREHRAKPSTLEPRPDVGRLTISCPDRPGIVAAVAGLFAGEGANLIHADQHSTDPEGGRFFMRVEFHLPDLREHEPGLNAKIGELAGRFGMSWQLSAEADVQTVAIFASREDHCLLDLLWRRRRGELPMTLAFVASNHETLRPDVSPFGIPFHHVAMDDPGAGEHELLALVARHEVDLVVLARYMRILSADFLDRAGIPLINIHHSFLPAFAGADPYRAAHERGVKLIGATAHYVTAELDEGPIIAQDTVPVSHRETIAELKRVGADLERTVLARAVRWHLERRILLDGRRTVVFR
jgi:formyltetrahydrofolate deformylase